MGKTFATLLTTKRWTYKFQQIEKNGGGGERTIYKYF